MAATLGTINPDTFHGQDFAGLTFKVYPFTGISNTNTFQLPTRENPVSVSFQSAAATDIVAVTMHATTKLVTFNTAGATAFVGNLIVACGGHS